MSARWKTTARREPSARRKTATWRSPGVLDVQTGDKIVVVFARLFNFAVDIHIARLLMWDTANRIAKGLPAKREASITKLFCTEMLNRAAYTGMQVCGGIGYSMESNMQLHFRNARLGTIGAGSSEVMRNVIAKDLGIAQG